MNFCNEDTNARNERKLRFSAEQRFVSCMMTEIKANDRDIKETFIQRHNRRGREMKPDRRCKQHNLEHTGEGQ
jgi:hypothetical protein